MKMKSIVGIILTVLLTFQNIFAVEYGKEYRNQPTNSYAQTFKDVNPTYWAFEYVSEMAQRGVLNGYPNGYFYPENSVTRAEFAKIMTSAASLSIAKPQYQIFQDVDINEWYAPYVHTACNYLSGYNYPDGTYYLPEANALREDIAVALVKLKGYDTTGADISMLKAMFTDYSSISPSAMVYVATAIENGLISGYDDNTFRGQNTITRAEAATLLWRAYQYGNANKNFDIVEKSTSSSSENTTDERKTAEEESKPGQVSDSNPDIIADDAVQTPPEPEQTVTAEVDTIWSGDNRISEYCLVDGNIGYFVTVQDMGSETWIDEVFRFDENQCVKIADYNDFYGETEMETADGYTSVILYPGNRPYEMYISDGNRLTLTVKGEINSELDSSGTEDVYVTIAISKDGDFEVTGIKNKTSSGFEPKYKIGKENDRIYNYIDGKTYSYNADSNQIYVDDLINGGENKTKVSSGMPANRTAGLWENGYGVFTDKKFYTLSPNGNYDLFYELSDSTKINDNLSMLNINDFYIINDSVYFTSQENKTLRKLKKVEI